MILLASMGCGDETDGPPLLAAPDANLPSEQDASVDTSDGGLASDMGLRDTGPRFPPHCSNELFDEAARETDVDCGGDCEGCGFGLRCASGADCGFGLACGSDGVCDFARCEDGILNGNETDVDCGGPESECYSRCQVDQVCQANSDCDRLRCRDGLCEAVSCEDAILNGNETDVDCGGPDCPACGVGSACLARSDCPADIRAETDCQAAGLCTVTGTKAIHIETFSCLSGRCEVQVEDLSGVACERMTEGMACADAMEGAWSDCAYAAECSNEGTQDRLVATPTCRAGLCDGTPVMETRVCGQRNTDNNLCGGTQEWSQIMCVRNRSSNACSTAGTATRNTNRCVQSSCILVEERATNSCRFNPAGRGCGRGSCRFRANTCTNRRTTGQRRGRRVYYTRQIWGYDRQCDANGGCRNIGSERLMGRRENLQYYQGTRFSCSQNYSTSCP